MFFSVIIPVYQVEKYLKPCLDSVLAQTFGDFEMILVDDGSTDQSPGICDAYAAKDSRVKVIHQKNSGASCARNAATDLATGQYVIFLDSDDYLLENTFLEDIAQKAQDETDIICYKYRKFDDETGKISDCGFSVPTFPACASMAERIEQLVAADAFYCSPWTKAIKRSLLEDHGVRFQEGIVSEDQEWYYHVLLHASSIEGIDKSYIAYRQHGNSVSHSFGVKNLNDTATILETWKNSIENLQTDQKKQTALLHSLAKLYCNLLIGYTRCADPQKKAYYGRLKSLSSLMNYHKNPRVNTFFKLYKIGGFGVLMLFLKGICKVR